MPIVRPTTMVVATSKDEPILAADTLVVRTPLDLIARLEVDQLPIDTIILAGLFAADRVLVGFLGEHYPGIRVVADPDGLDITHGNQAAFSIR